MFGDRLELAEIFAARLASDGIVRGLIGPREVPRLWERHLLNSAALTELMAAGSTVADLGSGAGLPGIVLAIRRPDLRVTLVEPLLRRTTFLDEVVAELGLSHVEVVRARAEELHGRRTFGVVTSRALAPLPRLLGWSLPLLAPGGVMLAMKGSSASREVEEAASELARLGAGVPQVVEVGLPPSTATVVRVETGTPRQVGSSSRSSRGGTGSRPSATSSQTTRGRRK